MYVYVDAFTNREYEGELQGPGDTVQITGVGTITVSAFTGTIAAAEDPTDVDKGTLQATEKDSFHFKVPRITSPQSILNIYNEYSAEAAISLAAAVDAYIASFHSSVSAVTPDNTYGDSTTPIIVGFGTGEILPYDVFLELNQRLDEASVAKNGRRGVYPPWFIRALKRQLGIRETAAGDEVLRNGKIAIIDGVDVRESNLVPNTAGVKYKVMQGQPTITFAETISETQVFKPEANFDTNVKGLHVYGAKMTHPQKLALATISKGDLTA
jgi:hypothetical protein